VGSREESALLLSRVGEHARIECGAQRREEGQIGRGRKQSEGCDGEGRAVASSVSSGGEEEEEEEAADERVQDAAADAERVGQDELERVRVKVAATCDLSCVCERGRVVVDHDGVVDFAGECERLECDADLQQGDFRGERRVVIATAENAEEAAQQTAPQAAAEATCSPACRTHGVDVATATFGDACFSAGVADGRGEPLGEPRPSSPHPCPRQLLAPMLPY
jgi:hypothetical protein